MISIAEITLNVKNINLKQHDQVWKYIDISSVDREDKSIVLTNLTDITPLDAPSRAKQLVSAGDIIISTVRPNLNTVAVIPEELDGAIASTGFCILRADTSKVDRNYLFHYIKSEGFVQELVNLATGANYPAVSDKIIKERRINLPSLDEQRCIAAILDKSDSIIRKRKQAINIANEFLRATFSDMFGNPDYNVKKFPIGTIRDLVISANYGSSEKASEYSGNFPILRMGNITYQGDWDFTDLKYIDLDEKSKDKFLVRKGDLLFNRTNSKELVGKTAVFENDTEMAFAGYLVRVRANEIGNNYYISGYLNSLHGKNTLINMSKSIVGMANINAQEMQNIKILIPPKKLQDRYEEVYKAVKSKVNIHIESKKELEKLFNTLINKFFK